jgi:putative oxidoreductase
VDAALLVVRLLLGLALGAHGAQKLFGWYGGHGLNGTAGFLESIGFRPGRLFALAAGLGEFGGGLLTVAGLFGPLGPVLIILVMLVAILAVHWSHGFFAQSDGVELPLAYVTAALAIAFAGPGAYSLDALIGFSGWRPEITWALTGLAIVLALANVALRRPATAHTHA